MGIVGGAGQCGTEVGLQAGVADTASLAGQAGKRDPRPWNSASLGLLLGKMTPLVGGRQGFLEEAGRRMAGVEGFWSRGDVAPGHKCQQENPGCLGCCGHWGMAGVPALLFL